MTSAFRADDAPALSVAGLACERGERRLFEGLDFTLAAGEALLVVGGNGHGKTSLLRILAGLSLPAAGEVRWAARRSAPCARPTVARWPGWATPTASRPI